MAAPGTERRISRAPVVLLVGGLALAVGLVLLGAALADAPAPAPVIEQPGTDASPREVTVIMRDYEFNPTPLYLVPGETVRLTIFNGGLVEHELVLGNGAVQAAWAAADARATPPAPFATPPPASVAADVAGLRIVVASGASAAVFYQVPDNEQLQLMCHLPGHVERGMIGQVVLLKR